MKDEDEDDEDDPLASSGQGEVVDRQLHVGVAGG